MTPAIRPVGDTAVLLEFGTTTDPVVFDHILALEAAILADPPPGFIETTPAYATLLIIFDPLVTDGATLATTVLTRKTTAKPTLSSLHTIAMCSDPDLAPDLGEAATILNLSPQALLDAHFSAELRVYMYGFAPGYAYLDGVPLALRLPRKAVPVRSRPIGSVMIAGGQCLITTLPMPTGWWVIGTTRTQVMAGDDFLLQPGDRVRFISQPRDAFDAA